MEEGLLRKKVKNWLIGLGIDPGDLKIYIESLTHRSFAREINIKSRGNEQLEFLGDSVLSFIITSYLYKNFGYFPEGRLAKIRSLLISGKNLGDIAKKIRLDRQILLSENEESSKGRGKESILADSLEAFIGALYIDKGINFASQWFLGKFEDSIEEKTDNPKISDYKTYLQEIIQADYNKLVKYNIEKSEGPDHNKIFYSIAFLDDKIIGKGSGKSKKDSEQESAKNALKTLYDLKI
ncbi:MAG: ribonuclease III [Actinobacteria bacterium]|nr:ribonuclease III [Actinomycetota bacterium]MBU4450936.1 ribonuclease III [Actinomycetota bacterium]MCG2788402.1 ribonuclease III [Actinomycetes bacterium]